jgi:hypothetical protein
LQKRGRINTLPLFQLTKTAVKQIQLYLVLVPSSFFSIGAPPDGWSAGAFISPLGAAGAGSAGAGAAGAGAAGAGAGGGGGGGAGSSLLPHPAKVSIKAKRVVPDNKTILFPILKIHLLSLHISGKTVLLDNFFIAQLLFAFKGYIQQLSAHDADNRTKRIETQNFLRYNFDCTEFPNLIVFIATFYCR